MILRMLGLEGLLALMRYADEATPPPDPSPGEAAANDNATSDTPLSRRSG